MNRNFGIVYRYMFLFNVPMKSFSEYNLGEPLNSFIKDVIKRHLI